MYSKPIGLGLDLGQGSGVLGPEEGRVLIASSSKPAARICVSFRARSGGTVRWVTSCTAAVTDGSRR